MKRLTIGLLGMIFTASAAEYGWLRDAYNSGVIVNIVGSGGYESTQNAFSEINNLVLDEGDSLTFISINSFGGSESIYYYVEDPSYTLSNPDTQNGYFWASGGSTGVLSSVVMTDSNKAYSPIESRTIHGPTKIVGVRRTGRDYQYRINRSTDSDGTEKFSVSLDNDGDRVAVGYKENGTNSVVKVYQFDGTSWNQLGEDIE